MSLPYGENLFTTNVMKKTLTTIHMGKDKIIGILQFRKNKKKKKALQFKKKIKFKKIKIIFLLIRKI